eukprot:g1041.t1
MTTLDQLCLGDGAAMLQLATTTNNGQIEDASKVRRTRWGPPEDKPYKPLPYIDMPIGLSDKEVDQFLREQRLEELTDKIRRGHMEDVDPDIRAPSPPPVYDRNGNRLNTRDVRIRKNMLNEQNRLVRYMQKQVPGYVPPPDFRPQKLAKKLIIPNEKYPNTPFVQVILGVRGANHKRLQELTGCRIMIRGKGMEEKWQSEEDASLPQHVHIEADHEEQIEMADKLIVPLLNPDSEEFAKAQQAGLESLAKYNGFTVALNEKRCGICGALGHMGFECPENEGGQNWQMANVVCAICGDRGHPTSDCPQVNKDHIAENVNWKQEAAKKMEADKLYQDMMGEFGAAAKPRPGLGADNLICPPVPGQSAAAPLGPTHDWGQDSSMNIADELCAFFIGAKGQNILRLKAEAQCEINVEKFMNADGKTKTIRITGTTEQRDRAKALIQQEIVKATQKKAMADQGVYAGSMVPGQNPAGAMNMMGAVKGMMGGMMGGGKGGLAATMGGMPGMNYPGMMQGGRVGPYTAGGAAVNPAMMMNGAFANPAMAGINPAMLQQSGFQQPGFQNPPG